MILIKVNVGIIVITSPSPDAKDCSYKGGECCVNKILRNMIRCLSCGDIIESTYVHDYKVCRCGNVSVDGGKDYFKRSYPADRSQVDSYEELSQWE
ncbi:DUF7695 domain-containing protein [Paenibacillus alkaliterrae]